MALIYKYKCNNKECWLEIIDSGSILYLRTEDNKEIPLLHPLEERDAYTYTGKNIDQLFEEGRAFYKKNRVCLNCSKIDGSCKCLEKSNFVDISELENKQCPRCKIGKIEKIFIGQS